MQEQPKQPIAPVVCGELFNQLVAVRSVLHYYKLVVVIVVEMVLVCSMQ